MNKLTAVFLIFTLTIVGCKDVFEEDLTGKKVEVLAPFNLTESYQQTQLFWWGELDGALTYTLQIATPNFESIQNLIVDSVLPATKFETALSPNKYEWRVKAQNGSSETVFTVSSLRILSDSTENLENQIVVLKSPQNNLITNQLATTFQWDTVAYADEYQFEIASPDFNSDTLGFTPQILSENQYDHTFLLEGRYSWRVRASNSHSVTTFSTFAMQIDTAAPAKPQLQSPINNAQVNDTSIVFSWLNPTDNGTTVFDSLFIASDSLFTNQIIAIQPNGNNYQDSLGVGNYWWRVNSYDVAGNTGQSSAVFYLKIQ